MMLDNMKKVINQNENVDNRFLTTSISLCTLWLNIEIGDNYVNKYNFQRAEK